MSVSESERPTSRERVPGARRHEPWRRYDNAIFWLFIAALAWVPLYFASNRLFAWGVNAVLFGGLAAAYEIGLVASGRRRPVSYSHVGFALALFILLVGWILVQLATWTPEAWHSAIWQMARDALGTGDADVQGSISVSPDQGVLGLVRLVTAASAFWLSLQLCRDGYRADMFLRALVLIGTGYALFGIFQFVIFPDRLLWTEKNAYLDSLTSSFVNRNNYAAYAGAGLIAALGMLIETYRRLGVERGAPLRMQLAALLEATLRGGLIQFVGVFLIMAALFMTGSRAGIVCSLFGVMALLVIVASVLRRRRYIMAVLLPLLIVCGLAFMVYGEFFTDRIANDGGLDLRWAVAQRTIEATLDAPWTGFGYGSFDQMFSIYRLADMGDPAKHWDKAHNTYVELLFELGFPAGIAFGLMVGAILVQIFANTLRRRHAAMVSLLALAISIQLLLHALVDFSLQMQAVAISYWAVMGAGLAQSWSRRTDIRG
jgi:O-antigen ligase